MDELDKAPSEPTQADLFLHDLASRQDIGEVRGIQVPPQSNYARDEEWNWEERKDNPDGTTTVRRYHLLLSVEVEVWRPDGSDDAPG